MSEYKLIQAEEFHDAEHLLAALQRRDGRWAPHPDKWIFRGHADARWSLTPSALRPGSLSEYEYTRGIERRHGHRKQIEKEHSVLRAFVESCDAQGLAIPDDSPMTRAEWRENIQYCAEAAMEGNAQWPPNATLSMLALAQHYGVPTRLLDWTARPLVAAYFAAVEAARWITKATRGPAGVTHLEIWAIDRRGLNILASAAPARDCVLKVVAPSPAHNPNLHAQMGVFTLLTTRRWDPYTRNEDTALDQVLERRFYQLSSHSFAAAPLPWVRRIKLPVTEAPRLLRLLSYEWVSATYLYPGYRGVARGLLERRFWDDPQLDSSVQNRARVSVFAGVGPAEATIAGARANPEDVLAVDAGWDADAMPLTPRG
ncbi:MAG TPA: FRG domain-containing protein [Longimicrobium sp.]